VAFLALVSVWREGGLTASFQPVAARGRVGGGGGQLQAVPLRVKPAGWA
jgi:hypothetical protein